MLGNKHGKKITILLPLPPCSYLIELLARYRLQTSKMFSVRLPIVEKTTTTTRAVPTNSGKYLRLSRGRHGFDCRSGSQGNQYNNLIIFMCVTASILQYRTFTDDLIDSQQNLQI